MTDQHHDEPQLEPAIIVIFGITGDLSQRYLLPSLYHLIRDKQLHPETEIIGVTRREVSTEDLLQEVERSVNEADNGCDQAALAIMKQHTTMFKMDLNEQASYQALHAHLDEIEDEKGVCMNRLYYLSIPPQVYRPVIKLLGSAGLNASCQHGRAMTRLLVEKPFGFDLTSAKELISETDQVFGEEQVFRIDHYLAKETVQNILTFRFQNPIFESLWNREHITNISISAHEKIGIEGRAVFYEELGALRDFIQSHLMQIAALITMDQPGVLDSEHIHAVKQAVMHQFETVPANKISERVIRGQYDGYRAEVDNHDSVIETYAAVTVYVNSPRWQGVPIRLSTGKALKERKTEIVINFADRDKPEESSNKLIFRIQPNEGIELHLLTKRPGFTPELETTVMNFSYSDNPDTQEQPNAYERVLVDAIRGDHTLFATSDEVLNSWRVLQPVIDAWSTRTDDLRFYTKGIDDLTD